MQLELMGNRTEAERDITVLLRAPLRAFDAEEATPHGEPREGKWGTSVQSTGAATRGLTPRSVDPGGTDR